MAEEYANVTIARPGRLWTLWNMMIRSMNDHPEGTPEHQMATHIREAVDAQIGHGGKAFD